MPCPSAVFLVPSMEEIATGGNVYNREVLAHAPSGTRTVSWPVETPPPDPTAGLDGAEIVIVDSLLVQHASALRALRTAHPRASLVLLAHYLACVDPSRTHTDAADAERALLPLFDATMAPSRFVCRAIADAGGPPGLCVPPGLPTRYRALPVPPPDRTTVRLLTVANLLPGKGLDGLLAALEQVADLRWTWSLVGESALDPAYAEAFRARAAASPVANRLHRLGRIDGTAMPRVYDAADVFVLPSRFETCSLATREAMARGRPVVATAVGGLPENLGDAPAGRLVPPDDVDAFASALRALLTDPDARRAMGTAARRRGAAFPSWPEAARHFWAAVDATT